MISRDKIKKKYNRKTGTSRADKRQQTAKRATKTGVPAQLSFLKLPQKYSEISFSYLDTSVKIMSVNLQKKKKRFLRHFSLQTCTGTPHKWIFHDPRVREDIRSIKGKQTGRKEGRKAGSEHIASDIHTFGQISSQTTRQQ